MNFKWICPVCGSQYEEDLAKELFYSCCVDTKLQKGCCMYNLAITEHIIMVYDKDFQSLLSFEPNIIQFKEAFNKNREYFNDEVIWLMMNMNGLVFIKKTN